MALNSYVAEPMSTRQIRRIVREFRRFLKVEFDEFIDVVKYLDFLTFVDPMYDYQIVEDDELPERVQGETDVVNHIIRIKQSIYEKACDGDECSRMTIAHEIGHYVLVCVEGITFAKNTNRIGYVVTYKDPEWQATVFASEFLAPSYLIKDLEAEEISKRYGVTLQAASTQLRHLGK